MSDLPDVHSFEDDDLAGTAERLRGVRIEPTALELDRALTQARRRAERPQRSTGGFWRSKVAIVSILTLGFATSGAGATLAFQGSSGTGDASSAQYAAPLPTPQQPEGEGEDGEVTPPTQPGDGDTDTIGGGPDGEVRSNTDDSAPGGSDTSPGSAESGDDAVQPNRQVTATGEADGGELPFTGLAAIPVIALGLGLLVTGVVLQRRAGRLPA